MTKIIAKWNISRGSFRLWLVFAVLWAIVFSINTYPIARDNFEHTTLESKDRKELKPWELYQLDSLRRAKGCPSIFDSRGVKDLSDEELYKIASGINIFDCLPTAKSKIMTDFLFGALGIPLIVLAIGAGIYWALLGFRKTDSSIN